MSSDEQRETTPVVRVGLRRIGAAELVASDEELHGCPFIRSIPDGARGRLLDRAVARRFPAQATVFAQGDGPGPVLLVLRGEARLVSRSGGDTFEFAGAGKGQIFGEAELESGARRVYSAVALAELDVLELGREDVVAVLGEAPALRDYVHELCRERKAALDGMSEFLGRW
jgi:CRP-like cAMP-binding protein